MGNLRIGAHLSVAKGLPAAALFAHRLGLDFFQYFTRNPRGGGARAVTAREREEWQEVMARLELAPPVAHLPYTVNLAAAAEKPRAFARTVLHEDLRRAAEFGAVCVVAHPGHHTGDRAGAVARIIELLAEVEEIRRDGPPYFLLETMAGQGREIGGSLEELAAVFEGLGWPPGLGVCLDTAHLFAAGGDLRDPAELDRPAAELDRLFGRARVRLLHLNDSRAGLGTRRDRHELIGKGQLGDEGIRRIVTHPFFGGLPMILETTVAEYEDYAGEAARVRLLAGGG